MSTSTRADHFSFSALPAATCSPHSTEQTQVAKPSQQIRAAKTATGGQSSPTPIPFLRENFREQETSVPSSGNTTRGEHTSPSCPHTSLMKTTSAHSFLPGEGKRQRHFPLLRGRLRHGDVGSLLEPGGILGPTVPDPSGVRGTCMGAWGQRLQHPAPGGFVAQFRLAEVIRD